VDPGFALLGAKDNVAAFGGNPNDVTIAGQR
jgi:carboxylesterase type B